MKGFCIISHDIEAAAFQRALGAEGADDHMASGFEGRGDCADISKPFLWRGEEVKDGAIVPDIKRTCGKAGLQDISVQPAYGFGSFAQTGLRRVESGLRDVERGDVRVSARDQVID